MGSIRQRRYTFPSAWMRNPKNAVVRKTIARSSQGRCSTAETVRSTLPPLFLAPTLADRSPEPHLRTSLALRLVPDTHDVVIRGGSILDGTGRPAFVGDLAIDGDRIAAVGRGGGPGAGELRASAPA